MKYFHLLSTARRNKMKSIGQILKNTRVKKGYSVEDIRLYIKVHPKYIIALETDDYSIFEGKVHSKGFLKIYAQFLELNADELLALWRREYERFFEPTEKPKFSGIKPIESSKFVFTPSMLIVGSLLVLLLSFFSYLYIQYRQFTGTPTLDIYYPEDNQVLEKDILDLTGKSELGAQVFINNQAIVTNPDGGFLTSLKLKEGLNTISIKAVNKLEKETEVVRTIIYRPKPVELPTQELTESTPSAETNNVMEDENEVINDSSSPDLDEALPQ